MKPKKVLKILEFDKILDKLQGYTESEPVKKRILKIEPVSDIEKAKAEKEIADAEKKLRDAENELINGEKELNKNEN